jgi:dienelactone hydrolase
MQPLETVVVLVGLVLITSLALGATPGRLWTRGAFLLIPALFLIQLALEGYRWHMLPAYLSVTCLAVFAASVRRIRSHMRSFILICAGLGIGVSAALATLFPVFALPPLSGTYVVGTVTLTLTNPAKFIGDVRKSRRLPVQLFYPAEPGSDGRRAFYMPRASTSRLKPQLALVRTRALLGVPISREESKFPVLIYSPSWNGNRHENTILAEDLASHGYVVICLDVPYETLATVYEDGTVIRTWDDPWLNFASEQDFARTLIFVEHHLEQRVADIELVIDHLHSLSEETASHQFIGRLDSDRIGILGFSFGGTTAAEVCRRDPRIKAGVNMDGFSYAVNNRPITEPFLYVSTTNDAPPAPIQPPSNVFERLSANDGTDALNAIDTYGGYIVSIRNADHPNFADWPLYSRLRSYTGAGTIDPLRALYIVRFYLLRFFDREIPALGGQERAAFPRNLPDAFVIARDAPATGSQPLTHGSEKHTSTVDTTGAIR